MSLSIIEQPNDKTLYCGTMNAANLNFTTASATTFNVDNINEKTLNHGVILQHDINVSNTGVMTFTPGATGTGIVLSTPGGTGAVLNAYEEYSVPCTLGGVLPNIATTLNLTQIGNYISLNIDAGATGAAGPTGAQITFSAVLPERFRPTFNTALPVLGQDNGALELQQIVITDAGDIGGYRVPPINYTYNAIAGYPANISIGYNLS